MMSKSFKAMVCVLLMGTALVANGQSTYEALRHYKNKAPRFGGPSIV